MRWILAVMAALALMSSALGQYATPANPKAAKAALAKAAKAYATTKSVFVKSPKVPNAKSRYVAATVAYGTASMFSPVLDRKLKYKQALNLYREALKHDPKNKEAKTNSDMIIAIYRQMGRPIPK